MKKILILLSMFVLISLCSCNKQENINPLNDINNKLSWQNFEISGNLDINKESYKFEGIHSNNITKLNIHKNTTNNYSDMYINKNNLYFKNGNINNELINIFGNIQKTNKEYILINTNRNNIDVDNIVYDVVYKFYNKALKEQIDLYSNKNPNYKKINGNKLEFSLSEVDAQNFLKDINITVKNNSDLIYDEMFKYVEENMQSKYKTLKDKIKSNLNKFIDNIGQELKFENVSIFTYSIQNVDGFVSETVLIKNNTTTINLLLNTKSSNESEILLPTEIINIKDLEPLTEEEQQKELDIFYSEKYPETVSLKSKLNSLGYNIPQYTTSLNGISLYSTKKSKSLNLNYDIVDEINIALTNGKLSKTTMLSCFSKKDLELYGIEAINTYIEEIETIIDSDFSIDMSSDIGYYESITEDWKFSVNMTDVSIDDQGLVTIEIIAQKNKK